MPNVNTGYEPGPSPWDRPREGGPRLQRQILFSPDTPMGRTFSDRVPLAPGEIMILTAHNLPEGFSVRACMAVTATESCGPSRFPGNEYGGAPGGVDLYVDPVALGGPGDWTITPERPQMVVSLPGIYRFELSDQEALGRDFLLELYRAPWPAGSRPWVER